MPQKPEKRGKRTRAPRIRVPNQERALFSVEATNFVGVIQRLSLTGGSAILAKGPIPHGTMGKMGLNTVYGTVTAHIEFLQTGADGIPLAQAFRFLAMDNASSERFAAAARQMEKAGFSEAPSEKGDLGDLLMGKLRNSIRRLSEVIGSQEN